MKSIEAEAWKAKLHVGRRWSSARLRQRCRRSVTRLSVLLGIVIGARGLIAGEPLIRYLELHLSLHER